MDHRIVNEPTGFFRSAARMELKGHWLQAVIATGIFVVVIGIVSFFTNNLAPGVEFLSGIYDLIVFGPATVGIYAYLMKMVRRQSPVYRDCFAGFDDFGRCLLLGVRMLVQIMLWMMLFIVPGIIAAYRYSQAPLLLRDHPDWSPSDCIRESKKMMVGNKGSLFVLDLSFIGWTVLAMIPAGIYGAIVTGGAGGGMATMGFGASLVMLIFEIPMLFVGAYNQTARVIFYEELNRPVEVYTAGSFRGNAPFQGGYDEGTDPNFFYEEPDGYDSQSEE